MSLPYFSGYLGSLVVLTILFAIMAKNLSQGLNGHGKKPYLYASFSSLIMGGIAWLAGFLTKNLFVTFWVLSALFVVFGLVHQLIAKRKYFYAMQHNRISVMMGEILFAMSMVLFCVMAFSALQYFLKDQQYLFFPMVMSSLFFFVPMMIQNLFSAAVSIPSKEYAAWTFPIHQAPALPAEDPHEKVLVIGFELSKTRAQQTPTYFRSKAPENIKLGHLFYYFIDDYNELNSETPISVQDESGIPDDWIFRKKTKWFQRSVIYNPERNFRENGIVENTVIIANRVKSNLL